MPKINFQQFAFSAETESKKLLGVIAGRKYASIQNQDAAAILYVRLNAPAEVNAGSIRIMPGGFYELRDPCAAEEINIISTAATNLVNVVEGVAFDEKN